MSKIVDMAIKLVVFDMAGTTVSDNDDVHAALITAFYQHSYSIRRVDANKVMGWPKPTAIHFLLDKEFGVKKPRLESLTKEIHQTFLSEMISFYKNDASVKAKPNAEKTFTALKEKGIKVCLDTGFSRDIADTIIQRLGWKEKGLIDYSVTSDEVKNGRPYPDLILKAMRLADVKDPREVAKVGDTISDLQEGSAAGCRYVIGITTGAYKAEELAKHEHTHLINDLQEILAIVSSEAN